MPEEENSIKAAREKYNQAVEKALKRGLSGASVSPPPRESRSSGCTIPVMSLDWIT